MFGVKRLLYPERPDMFSSHQSGGLAITFETESEASYPVICACVCCWPAWRWRCFVGYLSHCHSPCSGAFRGMFGVVGAISSRSLVCVASCMPASCGYPESIDVRNAPAWGGTAAFLSDFGACCTKRDIRSGRGCDVRSQTGFSLRTRPAGCQSGHP